MTRIMPIIRILKNFDLKTVLHFGEFREVGEFCPPALAMLEALRAGEFGDVGGIGTPGTGGNGFKTEPVAGDVSGETRGVFFSSGI